MKFMNMKRFASTVMAGALTMSLAVPAFAADSQTVITATYAETALEVTVPANTGATINPYGLPVTMEDATTVLSGQPITISTPLMIENKSAVALKVGASVATTVETGMTLATAATGVADKTTKELYVEFQAFEAAGIDGATVADPTETNPAWAALKDADAVLKAVLATGATPVNATAVTAGKDLVLREGKDGLSQAGGVAFVRLSGVVAKKPITAWATTDKLVATITYSFEPAVYSKSAGTFGSAPSLDADNGTARNLTLTLPTGVTPNDDGIAWTWDSSDGADVSLADASASGAYAVAITPNTKGTVTITATFVGADGITYTATSAAITISGT